MNIHPQLLEDCHRLGRLRQAHLLLHKNAEVAWFIVVPETPHAALHDIADEPYRQLMQDIRALAKFVSTHFTCDKVNIASIGNVVPQLHIHVIARHQRDACWPSVVWGNLTKSRCYERTQIDEVVEKLTSALPQFTTAS